MTEHDPASKRFDYAWGWFQFHAKQRTDMFNYFLIVTGILATAFVDLGKEGHPHLARTLAGLGVITASGFFLLDLRNKRLVDKSAHILDVLEKNEIFAGFRDTENNSLGLCKDHLDYTFEKIPRWLDRMTHHSFIFRGIEFIVAVGWYVFARAV